MGDFDEEPGGPEKAIAVVLLLLTFLVWFYTA